MKSEKRPSWHQIRQKFPNKLYQRIFPISLILVALEWFAGQYFFVTARCYSCRLLFQVTAATFALLGAWGIYQEYQSSQEERIGRMWQIATSPVPGNSGKIPALEFLHQRGEPLAGIGIPKSWLKGVKLEGANLVNSNLAGANLTEAILPKSNFYYSNLEGTDFHYAVLTDADFSKTTLRSTAFVGASLGRADFADIWIDGMFNEANLTDANFKDAKFDRAFFDLSCAKSANFTNADFAGSQWITFNGTDLSGANLTNSKGLSQLQLDQAGCAHTPPNLTGTGLTWSKEKICDAGELSACDKLADN